MEKILEEVKRRMSLRFQRLPETKRTVYESVKKIKSNFMLLGPRGVGKTTLLLQMCREQINRGERILYTSADWTIFPTDVYKFAEYISKRNYSTLIIDEVSFLPEWGRRIKEIVDDNVIDRIIISSSSSLALTPERTELARRFIEVKLMPLTLREYVYFKTGKLYPKIKLSELLKNWRAFSSYPYVRLDEYMKFALPFFREPEYENKVLSTLERMFYSDILAIRMTTTTARFAKPLFVNIARSRGNEISLQKLSQVLGISKGSVAVILEALENLGLLIEIPPCTEGRGRLAKRRYAITPPYRYVVLEKYGDYNPGILREDFFVFHFPDNLCNTSAGDFSWQDIHFEIGGKTKTKKQLIGVKGFVIKDSPLPEEGLPLYLFGYLG